MKRFIKYISIFLVCLSLCHISVKAKSKKIYVNFEKLEYSTNKKDYKKITEYKDLDTFLKDYKSNNMPKIYITDFLYDGISSVKTPDLDEFIENDTNDIEIKTLKIKVFNVNLIGNVEFNGNIKGAMIGVDTNNRKGNINIILNNANIDTDSKNAPAIFVYNKDKNNTDCKVTIKTTSGSKNYIEGGKLKKVSLIASDKLENYYDNYYYNGGLGNYMSYPSYYGIYTNSELKNILFTTVQADNEDIREGSPLFFYKGGGAISSDTDLYFKGDGYLKVTSKNSEGIETKGNLIFSGGKGDYEVYAKDDCLNTTTPSTNGIIGRNNLTINVKSLLAYVSLEAKEGDAIDSNGKLIINGGHIYAIAHPKTEDAGLDSENGIFINKGTILATGVMLDKVSDKSKQKFIYANFEEVNKDSLITIKNQNNEIITAFKTDRTMKNIIYSSPKLDYESYKIFVGGTIEGQVKNGLYTKIDNYTDGEEIQYENINATHIEEPKNNNNINNTAIIEEEKINNTSDNTNNNILKIIIIGIILLIVFMSIYIRIIKGKKGI